MFLCYDVLHIVFSFSNELFTISLINSRWNYIVNDLIKDKGKNYVPNNIESLLSYSKYYKFSKEDIITNFLFTIDNNLSDMLIEYFKKKYYCECLKSHIYYCDYCDELIIFTHEFCGETIEIDDLIDFLVDGKCNVKMINIHYSTSNKLDENTIEYKYKEICNMHSSSSFATQRRTK